MKKLMGAVLGLGLVLFGAMTVGTIEADAHTSDVKVATYGTNVGDGQTYNYVITSIEGNEIHGLPLNKKGTGNRGIFLLQEEVSFKVKVGDKIAIVWGDYEDEFKSIKKIKKPTMTKAQLKHTRAILKAKRMKK